MKVRRFKVDEWILYCPFPESNFVNLKEHRQSAVILEVLDQKDQFDYRIFIDDGTSTMRKVKEESLFPHQKTK